MSSIITQIRKILSAYQDLSTFVQACILVGGLLGLGSLTPLNIYWTYVSIWLKAPIKEIELKITPLLLLVTFLIFLVAYILPKPAKFKIRLRKPYYFIREPHICEGKLAYKTNKKFGKIEIAVFCPKHRCKLMQKSEYGLPGANIYFICPKRNHRVQWFYNHELKEGYNMACSIAESRLKF